jgi:hypothetical protein
LHVSHVGKVVLLDLDFHFLQRTTAGWCCCSGDERVTTSSLWTLWTNEYPRALEYDDQSGVELHRSERYVSCDVELLLLLLFDVMVAAAGELRLGFLDGGNSMRGDSW